MSYSRKEITKEQIEEAIKNSSSMIGAARYLGVSRNRFNRYAKLYGLFEPNQSGKGTIHKKLYSDEEIFSNRGCVVSSSVLIKRLKQIREWKCDCCGLTEWMGKPLSLEIHHIDGDRYNNNLDNLQILCPNCHSLTENWRSRNQRGYSKSNPKVTNEEILKALEEYGNIFAALQSLGMAGGANYKRVYDILKKKGSC